VAFDPIKHYNDHRRVKDGAQLSPEEEDTLRGMDRSEVDDLIDIDFKAYNLHDKVKPQKSGGGGAASPASSNVIMRVGASSY
jgi:hypothetical protein